MASNEQEEMSTKAKLSKLQCPFTWEILDSMIKYVKLRTKSSNDEKEDIIDFEKNYETSYHLELLLISLLECYKAVLSADNDEAIKRIEKAEEILMQIQQEQIFHQIMRAIEHVFYATKCFFLYDNNDMDELEDILQNIVNTEDFSNIESGALYGCQSVIWSCLNDFGMDKAVDTAKKAVEKNQDCALWHFILAKNLRRQRRSINCSSGVSDMEKMHFEIAYAMSKNHFGIYYLQMRIESFYKFNKTRDYMMQKNANEKEVTLIAKQILKTKPTNYRILLKLALIFLRANSSDERLSAKECLDAVNKITQNHPTYLHYTAMLYKKSGDYKEALKYFKKAAEFNNIIAELSYIEYGWETGELEPLPYLLRMLKKYEQSVKERRITILLAISITYYSLHKDILNAAEYFFKALTVDPVSKKFKVFYKFLDFSTSSISSFLNDQFCPLLKNKYPTQEMCGKIKQLLNVNDITDLTEELCALSVDAEEKHSDLNIK